MPVAQAQTLSPGIAVRIAKIQAVVVADTQQFDQALKNSEAGAKEFSASVSKSTAQMLGKFKADLDKFKGVSETIRSQYADMEKSAARFYANRAAENALQRIARDANVSGIEFRKMAQELNLATINMGSFASASAKSLGFQTKGDISAQIKEAGRAYQEFVTNESTSSRERAAAQQHLIAKVQELTKEYRTLGIVSKEALSPQQVASASAKSLGFTMQADITAQVAEAKKAYDALKSSGVATSTDISIAEKQLIVLTKQLNDEYKSLAVSIKNIPKMSDLNASAANTLGMRTRNQISEEIKKTGEAYLFLKRNATLSAKEIETAQQQLINKTRVLAQEYKNIIPPKGIAPVLNADTQAAQSFQSVMGQIKTVVAGYVGFQGLQDIAKTSVDIASMQKTFFAITGSVEGARGEMAYLREESQRLGLDFMTLTDAFKGFSAAGKTAGMDAKQVREIFTSVTEASTVLGLNSQKTGLALYALEQMISKGCHAPGTPILMFDGTVCNVEDVRQGELLLGPDGTARKVLLRACGKGPMFRVSVEGHGYFDVNDYHVLYFSDGSTLSVRETIETDYSQKFFVDKSGSLHPFKILSIGEGEYFGFLLDGDSLYFSLTSTQLPVIVHNSVSMEELRRQLGDQLPGAFQIGAKAMGLTTKEFAKLVETGKLASADFLPKFAAGLREAFGHGLPEAMKTPRAEIQRLMNEITFAKEEIGNAGFLQGLSGAAKELTTAFKTDEMKESLRGVGHALGEVTGAAAKLGTFALGNGAGLLSLASGATAATIAGRTLVPIIKTIGMEIATMPAGMRGVGMAAKSIGSSLAGAFGGPVGLAVTALAGGITYLSLQESEGEKYSAKYAESIGAIAEGGEIAAGAIDNLRSQIQKMSAAQQAAELRKIQESINKQIGELKAPSLMEIFAKSVEGSTYENPYADVINKISEQAKAGTLELEKLRDEIDLVYAAQGDDRTRDFLRSTLERLVDAGVRTRELNDATNQMNASMGIAAMSVDGYAAALSGLVGQMRLVTEYGKDIDQAIGKTLNMGKFLQAQEGLDYKQFTIGLSDTDKAVAEGMKSLGLSTGEIKLGVSGNLSFLPKEADRIRLEEFIQGTRTLANEEKRLKDARKSSRSTASIDRTAFQASEAYEKARDAAEQLRLKNAELIEQLQGAGLSSAFAKIDREYNAQLNSIEEKARKLAADVAAWQKSGKTDAEGLNNIRLAQEEISAQKQLLEENRKINEALARRNDLERTYKAEVDYSRMIGDVYSLYDAEVKLLSVEIQKTQNLAEQAGIREKIRQATARRDMDIGGMLTTGWQEQATQAGQTFIDFWEKGVPGAVSSSGEAFADFFADIGSGTKGIGSAWEDLGKTFQSVLRDFAKNLMNAYFQMILFGNKAQSLGGGGAGGGFGGGLMGLIGGLFTGGSSGASTSLYGQSYMWNVGQNHSGGMIGSGVHRDIPAHLFDGAARYHSGGMIGLKPGEIPIVGLNTERVLNPQETRAYNAGLARSGGGQNVNITVNNTMSDSAGVEIKESPSANGQMNIELTVTRIVGAKISSGTYDGNFRNRYGISPTAIGR